jgi:hypothetical protein
MSKEYKLEVTIPAAELDQFLEEFGSFPTNCEFIDSSPQDSEFNLKWRNHSQIDEHQEAIDFLKKHQNVHAFRKENCTFWIYLFLDNIEQGNFEWSSERLLELSQHVSTLCLSVTHSGGNYVWLSRH